MAYAINIELMQGYVRAHAKGERRLGDAELDASQAGQEIVQFCRDADVYKVLLVLELRGRLSAVDSYELVANSKNYGWTHEFKLAFVETNKESIEDVRFTETVAVNRAYAVKVFTDEEAAVDWLLQ